MESSKGSKVRDKGFDMRIKQSVRVYRATGKRRRYSRIFKGHCVKVTRAEEIRGKCKAQDNDDSRIKKIEKKNRMCKQSLRRLKQPLNVMCKPYSVDS